MAWSKSAKPWNEGGQIVFLEEPDGGDAGRASIQASASILEADASERKHGDGGPTSGMKSSEARWLRCRSVFLFEHRSEDGKVGTAGGCLRNFFGRMARNTHQEAGC